MRKFWLIISILFAMLAAILLFLICGEYSSWHLNYMDIDKLWAYSQGETQIIAFIDTGLSEELMCAYSDRIVSYWNIIDDNSNVIDRHGHGTEMVSVACGAGYMGQHGISPKAKIIVIKAVSDFGVTNNDYLYNALQYAKDNGATIVNISLGGFATDDRVSKLVHEMIDEGIAVVCAAGDYGNKDLLFPASISGVISVEALDQDLCLWHYSNKSNQSIVRAPGVDIQVLSFDGDRTIVTTATGTSQAAAIISGYLALLLDVANQRGIQLENEGIIDILNSLNTKSEGVTSNYTMGLELLIN